MNIRIFFISILLASGGYALSQPGIFDTYGPVYADGQITGYPNSEFYLTNQNIKGGKVSLDTVTTDANGKFVWKHAIPFQDFYTFNFKNGASLSLVLNPRDSFRFNADIKNLVFTVTFERSQDNTICYDYIRVFSKYTATKDSLTQVYRANPALMNEVNAQFKPVVDGFIAYRSEMIRKYPESPALAATLNSFDQKNEWRPYTEVVRLLNTSFHGSPTLQNINAYVNQQNAQMEAEAKLMAAFQPGKPAPEIAVPRLNVDVPVSNGDTLRLSDFKGKVVLVDFWASWCKPCRMENPNVVKNYNKYNKDGFTVFSVSLDTEAQKAAWIKAIETDGLIWPNHGSDLKGWNSAPVKTYMVKGIPFTVLIDKEGKIIGTNLRGEELEKQLTAIFGY